MELSGNSVDQIGVYSNSQEDLSILLFIILYHQVSCLDYYHSESEKYNSKFDLSLNLKEHLIIPFNLNVSSQNLQFELKQLEKQQFKTYELNYKLNSLIKMKLENYNLNLTDPQKGDSLETKLTQILDRKFRLFWNFKWHGGSLLKLCNDLLNNEQFVQKENNSKYGYFILTCF